jgi:hypothetical protein
VSRLQTSFVLGYHGCDKATGKSIVSQGVALLHSEKPFDWLGSGMYFWESDPERALEWAREKKYGTEIREPFVIGAVIDLGNCLDLLARTNSDILRDSYENFVEVQKAAGKSLPVNKNVDGKEDPDGELRFLDCAVLNHLLKRLEGPENTEGIQPYDTVRGYFREGDRLYPGSGFHHKNHSQIAVRNTDCIKGFFLPLPPLSI